MVSSRLHGARKVEGYVLVYPVDELAILAGWAGGVNSRFGMEMALGRHLRLTFALAPRRHVGLVGEGKTRLSASDNGYANRTSFAQQNGG